MIREAKVLTSAMGAKISSVRLALLLGGEYNGKHLKDWGTVPSRMNRGLLHQRGES